MAPKKNMSNETAEKKIDIPQNIHDVQFFKRLPYELTEEQWKYIEAIWDKKNIGVFVNAKAGSSKTTIAVGMAMLMAQEFKMFKNIYYIISPCEEDKLGYAPGTIEDKTSMYMEPLRQSLWNWGYDPNKYIASDGNMDSMKSGDAIIHAIPHTFLRGQDLNNSFIICEESQNYKVHDLKKTLSRPHDNCKVVCIGEISQCDLRFPQDSGFYKYIDSAKSQDFCEVVELTENFRGKFSNWADSIS